MKNQAIVGAAALLTMVAGWNFYSPYYTLNQMRSAAEADDADKLASYVDFPALRADMRAQIRGKLASEPITAKAGGSASPDSAIASKMLDGMVDDIVTPRGLRAVFVANKLLVARQGITAIDGARPDLKVTRSSFNSFDVHAPNDDAGRLIFKRDGLGWKLSAMRMPAAAHASGT